MEPRDFFFSPKNIIQKQYEALRTFFYEGKSAEETAQLYGYKLSSFYSLTRDFRKKLASDDPTEHLFKARSAGPYPKDKTGDIEELIIILRKRYLSVSDIKAVLDIQEHKVSEAYIYMIIRKMALHVCQDVLNR